MVGAGAAAVVIAVAVIVVFALNLTGGSGTTTAVAEELPAYAHVLGEADAPVTVVEFGDFQ